MPGTSDDAPPPTRTELEMSHINKSSTDGEPDDSYGRVVTFSQEDSSSLPQSPLSSAAAAITAENDNHNTTTIVDEAQEVLAQSLLMFLYADLRLLSATGRVNTKFETLCIDSDRAPRTTAAEIAQLESVSLKSSSAKDTTDQEQYEGVSPAQIMAILIVELRQEVLSQRRRVKEQMEQKEKKGFLPSNPLAEESDDDNESDDDEDAGVMNKITDRKGRKEFETDMHSLLRSYNGMLAQDLKGVPEVKLERTIQIPKNPLRGHIRQSGRPWLRPGGLTQRLFSFDDIDGAHPQNAVGDGESDDEASRKSQGSQASLASLTNRLSIAARFTSSLLRKSQARDTADTAETDRTTGASSGGGEGNVDTDNVEFGQTLSSTTAQKKKLSGIAEEIVNFEDDASESTKGESTKGKEGNEMDEEVPHQPDETQGATANTPPEKIHQSKLFEIIESFRGVKGSTKDPDFDLQSLKSDPGPDNNNASWRGDNSELFDSTEVSSRAPIQQQPPGVFNRRNTLTKQLTQQIKTYAQNYRDDHALHNKFIIPTDDYETFAGAEDVGNRLVKMTSSMNLANLAMSTVPEYAQSTGGSGTDPSRILSENELLDFMTKCIESRSVSSLDFMTEFFRDNTISQTMVKSKAQVVWLQDWYPIKDCLYAISVDKKKKRVLVVFRGAITRADWSHGFDAAMKKGHNPVKDEYEGKKPFIRYHRGFYTYLLRMRKDTQTRKYDEIANKVFEYGNKLIGDDFTVTVNGYSLGGALSVLFGLHASTDPRFTQNGPVKIFSYGAPYSVSHSFADAFRHQEMSGKVQHARFYNSNDLVAHMPFNAKPTHRGSNFCHVGIDVKLYSVPDGCSLWGSRYPRFYYNKRTSGKAAYWRAIKLNSLLNTTWPWRIKDMHGLPELQKRIARAILVSENTDKNSSTKNPYLRCTLDEAYEAMVYKTKKE